MGVRQSFLQPRLGGMWPTWFGLTIVLWACGSISGWHLYGQAQT